MAREKNRHTTVLERNLKIPIIYKEIEKQLKENSEFNKINSAKLQIDNILNKNDSKKRLSSYMDENTSLKSDFRLSGSAEDLSKSFSAFSNKSKTLPRNNNEFTLDKSNRLMPDDISQDNYFRKDDTLLRTPRSSGTSYSSMNSAEMFISDFIIQGEILMKIEHLQQQGVLKIRIVKCRNLSVVDERENSTNPYVKIYLLPDKSKSGKRKTSVKKNDINPLFDEEFQFKIDRNSVINRTLNVSVWHYEHMRMNIFMGELSILIYNVKLNDPQEIWYSLKTKENIPHTISLYQYKGEILIGLQFKLYKKRKISDSVSEYNTGVFNIFIKNGKYIGDEKNIPNTFVRCNMHHLNTQIGKKETKIISSTTNPIWDEIFSYPDIEKDGLQETEIELFVLNKKIMKTEFLGKLLLSNNCKESNVSKCREKDILLWRKFLKTSNDVIVEDYLPMRSITK